MDSIQIGPFTLQYAPEYDARDWTEPAHWYVYGNVCVTGATPEECVRLLHTRLLKTLLALTVPTPGLLELLGRAEQLIAQMETLEEWLQSRASQVSP